MAKSKVDKAPKVKLPPNAVKAGKAQKPSGKPNKGKFGK